MVAGMATSPDLYFNDLWNDANMGEVLQYLLARRSSWPEEVEHLFAVLPWEHFVNEPLSKPTAKGS